MKWSLRSLVPALVLLIALLQGLFFYSFSLREIDKNIKAQVVHDLTSTLSHMQGTLAYLFRKQDQEQIQQEITSLGEDARLRVALLVDETGHVMASIRIADRGRYMLDAIPAELGLFRSSLVDRLRLAQQQMRGDVGMAMDGSCVSGVFPVLLGGDDVGFRPNRVGALLACMDLGYTQQAVRYGIQQKMQPVALGLFLAAMLLAVLFHILVTRRVQRLLAVTHAFAKGDYAARVRMSGEDELSRIAMAFDAMAEGVGKAHQQLRERETRFRAIFDSTFQFIGLLDTDGVLLEANRTSLEFVDADAGDVIGKHLWDAPWWVSDADRRLMKAAVIDAVHGAFVRFETVSSSLRGVNVEMDFSLTPIRDESGKVVLLVSEARDISELKRIVQEREQLVHDLEKAESLWERAMEFFVEPVFLTDTRACLVRANKAFYEILSLDPSTAVGMPVNQVMHPGGGGEGCQACAAHVHMTDMMMVMETDHPDNTFGRPVEITTRVIRDQDGVPQGVLAGIHDLSRQREMEAELRKHRDHLEEMVEIRTASLETSNRELEAFSYSVSHDLRSPLRAINGYSQFLLDDYADVLDEVARNYLRRMMAASERMGSLIDDLLQLAKVTRKVLACEPVDLSALAHEIMAAFVEQDPDRLLELKIQDGIIVDGDPGLLSVALQNLLSNAWKFTGTCPLSVIGFDVRSIDGRRVYCISDNGVGFDMEYAQNLFKPFHRLHAAEEYPGTGIGLATVERIIERHRGRIWAEAIPGSGATFCFELGIPGAT